MVVPDFGVSSRLRGITLAGLLCVTAACSHTTPTYEQYLVDQRWLRESAKTPEDRAADRADVTVARAIAYGNHVRGLYLGNVEGAARFNETAAGGLIGLATSAGILAGVGGSSQTIFSLVGAGGGTYAVGRTFYRRARQAVYLSGADAISCAIAITRPLLLNQGQRTKIEDAAALDPGAFSEEIAAYRRLVDEAQRLHDALVDALRGMGLGDEQLKEVCRTVLGSEGKAQTAQTDDLDYWIMYARQVIANAEAALNDGVASVRRAQQLRAESLRAANELVRKVEQIDSAVSLALLRTEPDLEQLAQSFGGVTLPNLSTLGAPEGSDMDGGGQGGSALEAADPPAGVNNLDDVVEAVVSQMREVEKQAGEVDAKMQKAVEAAAKLEEEAQKLDAGSFDTKEQDLNDAAHNLMQLVSTVDGMPEVERLTVAVEEAVAALGTAIREKDVAALQAASLTAERIVGTAKAETAYVLQEASRRLSNATSDERTSVISMEMDGFLTELTASYEDLQETEKSKESKPKFSLQSSILGKTGQWNGVALNLSLLGDRMVTGLRDRLAECFVDTGAPAPITTFPFETLALPPLPMQTDTNPVERTANVLIQGGMSPYTLRWLGDDAPAMATRATITHGNVTLTAQLQSRLTGADMQHVVQITAALPANGGTAADATPANQTLVITGGAGLQAHLQVEVTAQ